MIPTIEDHTTQALGHLTDSFRDREVIEGFVRAFASDMANVESQIFAIVQSRLIDSATNYSLDLLGLLVGQEREGMPDADYRAAIRLRIKINRSSGRAVDMVAITNLIVTGARYHEGDEASFEMRALNTTGPAGTIRSLRDAKPAGVHGVFAYSTWATTTNLVLGSSVGTSPSSRKYASSVGAVANAGVRISAQDIL